MLREPFIAACLCGLVAALLHLPTLEAGFVFDDIPAIQDNPLVTGEAPSPVSAFSTNFWGGRLGYEHVTTWRPLTTLGFRATARVFGLSPLPFHATNLFLHALVTLTLVLFVRAVFDSTLAGVMAGGLFAVLPTHVEAVAGAVNRAELQCALFYLLGLLAGLIAFRDRRPLYYAVALLAFASAVLSKEHGITWPAAMAVVLVYRVRFGWRGRPEDGLRPPAWAYVALLALTGGYFVARAVVLPAVLGGDVPPADNPLVAAGMWERLSGPGLTWYHYLRLLVAPTRMTADYSSSALEVGWGPEAVAGSLLMLAGLGLLVWSARRKPALSLCLVLFVVLYGLISNTLILNTIVLAERLLYLPSTAWCATFGVVMVTLLERSPQPPLRALLVGLALLVLTGYAVRSVTRSADWKDDLTLFESSYRAFPGSARMQVSLAASYLDRGMVSRAVDLARGASTKSADDADALRVLGDAVWAAGQYGEAMEAWDRAFALRPARVMLPRRCRGATATRRVDAIGLCEAAIAYWPVDVESHLYLGIALGRAGQTGDARLALERALALAPDHPAVLQALKRLR